jgi:hypothetical protein
VVHSSHLPTIKLRFRQYERPFRTIWTRVSRFRSCKNPTEISLIYNPILAAYSLTQ